jgi:copper(I)-binding protein
MRKTAFLFFIISVLLAGCATAKPDVSQNGIVISQSKVLLPGGVAMNGMETVLGGFMTIKNTAAVPDRLTGVSADFAQASLHETKMDGDVMTMDAITGVDLPAGKMVELRSGSYHIMFMNLTRAPRVGDTVTLVLEFEKAGKISLPVKVTDK